MAAAVFIATLAINVVVTLDDPFVLLSDAMAGTTTTSTTSTTTSPPSYACMKTITYGGISALRKCSTCGWNFFCNGSGLSTCTPAQP